MRHTKISLFIVLVNALTACGGGGGSSSSTTTTSGTDTTTAPSAPSISGVTAGNSQLSVAFTVPASTGSAAITAYRVTCGSTSAMGATSPLVVTGLTNAIAYECTVTATSSAGTSVASNSASGTPAGTGVPSGSITYAAAAPFSTLLATSYSAPTLTAANTLATRGRYLISDQSIASTSANYLAIGSTYSATSGYAVESGTLTTTFSAPSTYRTYMTKLVQLVVDATDASCYRMDSHLHPNNAIDFDASDSNKLKFRNNFGKASVAYGYVCFAYDTSSHLLKATKRYSYNTATYAHTVDSSFAAANYYVKLQGGSYTLVSGLANATALYFFNSPIDFSIPRDFNPGNTSAVTNAAASFQTKSIVASVLENTTTGIASRVNTTYKPQVMAAGANNTTKIAATAMLATIKASVEAAGESLRYDTAVYKAFRDGLLAGTLQSDAISDGVPGQNLVPYVFFTNEKDSGGKYHPLMVIVSYGNGGNPHGLQDIARPPGDGTTGSGYGSQKVTRYSNLDSYTIGIPMKNYGIVSSVTENGLMPTLLSDTNVTPTADNSTVYNYASTADNGIMITGAVMFPVYNNTLIPSQAIAELSAGGCHVGQGGGGPHCHADGYSTSGINGVYNDTDYLGQTHPPLIGFGYDGIALFGRYRTTDSNLLGYSTPLDAWGGHNHDLLGYHYHADASVTQTLVGSSTTYTIRSLIRGAYRGKTGSLPYAFGVRTPGNVYFGGL